VARLPERVVELFLAGRRVGCHEVLSTEAELPTRVLARLRRDER
jgi:hypothetical protein